MTQTVIEDNRKRFRAPATVTRWIEGKRVRTYHHQGEKEKARRREKLGV